MKHAFDGLQAYPLTVSAFSANQCSDETTGSINLFTNEIINYIHTKEKYRNQNL